MERDLQGRVPAAVPVQVSPVVLLPQSWQVLQRLLHHDGHRVHLDTAGTLLESSAQPSIAEDLRRAHLAGGWGPGLRPCGPSCYLRLCGQCRVYGNSISFLVLVFMVLLDVLQNDDSGNEGRLGYSGSVCVRKVNMVALS